MTSKIIAIIDYGMGNLGSVSNAFIKLEGNSFVSDSLEKLSKADAFILPGVGAFPKAVQNFNNMEMFSFLDEQIIKNKKPILGICLGMQLMADSSLEQGITKGLGWIPGNVLPIEPSEKNQVPHVGWNNLIQTKKDKIFSRIDSDAHFYFDHSYKFDVKDDKYIIGYCNHGFKCASVLRKKHIFATQFHPEKSQRNGLKILRNFMNFVELYKN